MDYQFLLYTKEEGIGIVTMNRPESLNALDAQAYSELLRMFQEIEADEDVRVVILTGSGEKAFSAGGDIVYQLRQDSFSITKFTDLVRKASDQIYNFSKPVIAAVNGHALGGGIELAMCCDFRIAAEHVKFGQPEINLGIIPGAGATQRLTRLIGLARAEELILTGDIIDANTALSIGLVNKVVPAANLMSAAKELARKLLSKSGVALFLAKMAVKSGAEMSLSSGLEMESICFASCYATEDQKEGMKAFMEKRKPQFRNK